MESSLDISYSCQFIFIQKEFFNISGNISGSPTSYIVHASNLVSDVSFQSSLFDWTSCEDDSGCPIKIPNSTYCPQSTIIGVSISTANKLGEGPRSNPFLIGIATCIIVYSRC